MPPYQQYDPDGEDPPVTTSSDTTITKRKPIGVPEDYPIGGGIQVPGVSFSAREGYSSARPLQFTRYYIGDELLPANYSADRVVEIQFNLERIGLLTRGNYSLGIWDPATQSAYKDLLGLSNARGQSAEQTMGEYLSIVQAGGGPLSSANTPPLVISKTPPEELESVFRRAVVDLTGRGWNSDQINQAISAYNQVETQRQEEAYNAQYFTGGGEVTAIPSPSSFIESYTRQNQPEDVAVESGLGFIDQFMSMASNPSWGG